MKNRYASNQHKLRSIGITRGIAARKLLGMEKMPSGKRMRRGTIGAFGKVKPLVKFHV
jgi:hypothetical protein